MFSPHFCGKKCPEKTSRKIPRKILQNLYSKNPPTHFCRLPRARNPAERTGFGLRNRSSKSQIASDFEFHYTLKSQCGIALSFRSEIASDFWGPRWASQSQIAKIAAISVHQVYQIRTPREELGAQTPTQNPELSADATPPLSRSRV